MFPTEAYITDEVKPLCIWVVAIPSNRVNVSYLCLPWSTLPLTVNKSQSPQIGSMFPTRVLNSKNPLIQEWGRNPLKSGQCFLQLPLIVEEFLKFKQSESQSPQIGSMFPTFPVPEDMLVD